MAASLRTLGPRLAAEVLARRSAAVKPLAGVLADGAVLLEPYDEARHLGALYAAFCPASSRPGFETAAVFDYLGKAAVCADTLDDTRRWITMFAAADAQTMVVLVKLASAQPVDASAVVRSAESGATAWCVAGTTSFLAFRPADLVVEIGGVAFCPRFQRTPVNTAATRLLLQHAFEVLGCRRVEWKCNSRNEPSRAAALRMGFTFEGIFRQHMIVKEAYNRDTAWFSMLADEWPERKAALCTFLDSSSAVDLFRRRAAEADAAGLPRLVATLVE